MTNRNKTRVSGSEIREMHVLVCRGSNVRQPIMRDHCIQIPIFSPCVSLFCQHVVFAQHSTGRALSGQAGTYAGRLIHNDQVHFPPDCPQEEVLRRRKRVRG